MKEMNIKMLRMCAGMLCMGVASMISVSAEGYDDAGNLKSHKIGVIVYNIVDEQVVAFRDYLENYIGECFQDVQFIYSSDITTPELEMKFIQDVCDAGAEGILSFNSYDLKAEVELCEANEVYYMRASSSVSDSDFEAVKDNPYYIGSIGPGEELEYQAGYDMAKFFADQYEGNEYFILSGGAGYGVGMHQERTKGILNGLQDTYGVKFDATVEELAVAPTEITAEAGELKVCIMSGFLDSEAILPQIREVYENHPYSKVLSVYPICGMEHVLEDVKLGVIDCYDEVNMRLFTEDKLHYVTGKFSSTIGPSFAAMYNAVTGYAEEFRENGNAFRLTQGFWTSDNLDDYTQKYTYSSSIVLNAYNYADLDKVCKAYNPDATLEDLKKLVSAYTFEDAVARRNIKWKK